MSYIEDHRMSSCIVDDQPPPSSCSSKGSYDNKTVFHKEHNEITINQESAASSMADNRKKLEGLNKKIDSGISVRATLVLSLFVLCMLSMMILYLPIIIFGISFYSIILVSHSLLLLCLVIFDKQVYQPLIDEWYILSCKTEGDTTYFPAYHPSRFEFL